MRREWELKQALRRKDRDSIFLSIPYSLGDVVLVLRNSLDYSHSMVLGGLEEISYTTRFTPFTLLMISLETFAKKS